MRVFESQASRRAWRQVADEDKPSMDSVANLSLEEWTPVDIVTLRAVSLAFAAGEALESVAEQLLQRISHLLQADSGVIFLLESADWIRPLASKGLADAHVDALHGAATWSIKSKGPIWLADPRRNQGSGAAVGPGDSLCVPVLLEGEALGAFVLSRGPSQIPFAERDLAVALSLANELALALERAQIEARLGREQVKNNMTQRQLEAYAEDFRATFESEKAKSAALAGALSELERTYFATVRSLAVAVEAKDEYTGGHISRVTGYGLEILQRVAPGLESEKSFAYGFLLHDVGKLAVPDAILGKAGPLEQHEWEVMRRHPLKGHLLLAGIHFLDAASDIVIAHHERWDGRGYPNELAGEEIPLGARVFSVADAYDAMTTDRPYRNALPADVARTEIERYSGTQFWPEAVSAFLSIPLEVLENTSKSASLDLQDV